MTNPLLAGARQFVRQQVEAVGGLFPMTLAKKSLGGSGALDEANAFEPRQEAEQTYPTQGSLRKTLSKVNGTQVREGESVISIIGGFLPDGIDPEEGDRVMVGNDCYSIVEVESSLTRASFKCRAKKV